MEYLVITGDGRFAVDPLATKFSSEYPDAWLFPDSQGAYFRMKMLRKTDSGARAVSTKAYEEDVALDREK